ncbi:MAG: GTP cyclohydrolase II [Myxococcales bacterium]|nr:GTP cyclohydrolase II [Myxococcales bacterium]
MPVPHSIAARRSKPVVSVSIFANARLPTRRGEYEIVSFTDELGKTLDDVAVIRGDVVGKSDVTTRIHSECLTGDVFGSVRCDCRDQLELALDRLLVSDCGVILYMRQEGRGIGIAHKVRAYELQERGLDTVDANHHLGFDDDLRDYSIAAAMIRALRIKSLVLHTNNLLKVEGMRAHGITVTRREPIITPPREENADYLSTKRSKSGHLL